MIHEDIISIINQEPSTVFNKDLDLNELLYNNTIEKKSQDSKNVLEYIIKTDCLTNGKYKLNLTDKIYNYYNEQDIANILIENYNYVDLINIEYFDYEVLELPVINRNIADTIYDCASKIVKENILNSCPHMFIRAVERNELIEDIDTKLLSWLFYSHIRSFDKL